jgi:tetrahydromethanopterin S-methyltransferase subunit G
MEAMSDKWSSERLDDLNRRVENGFNRLDADLRDIRGEVGGLRGEMNSRFEHVDARFEHMDARFDALQRTMLQLGGGAIAALIGLIATQL